MVLRNRFSCCTVTRPAMSARHCLRRLFVSLLLLQCAAWPLALRAAPAATDELVYKDGDRVHGRIVSDDGKTIVFRSNRFGEIRVTHEQATAVVGDLPAPATPDAQPLAAGNPTADDKAKAELEEERRIIGRLSATLRRYFGPWHGRLAFSSSVVNSTDATQSEVIEGKMERKWVGDELRFDARYEFSSTNEVTGTDITKGGAYWRHDLSRRWFTLLHPSLEWNRNYTYKGQEADYLLLQYELGGGITVWDRTGKKLRVGLAHNFYDVWNTSGNSHRSKNIESAFIEAEFALPWNVKLVERGIRYFSLTGGDSGWESQLEISKKFSENLVLALRHEVRYNQPDIRVDDYSSWRLLLGLDF